MPDLTAPSAVRRLDMPETVSYVGGMTVRGGERQLERAHSAHGRYLLDATYADTHVFPAPPYALEAFEEAASGGGMTYTPYVGDKGVIDHVSANVNEAFGIRTTGGSGTILTPGTQSALFLALSALIEPGDTVVLPDPDYLSTERTLRYLGAAVERVPLIQRADGYAELDVETFRNICASSTVKLVIFSNPNNPTGAVYAPETLELIAEEARARDFWVLADQLYCRLVYDNSYYGHISCFDGMEERTITTLGPSKTESLSGYRLGVGVAPVEIIERMEDIQSIAALRAPAYAQHVLSHWIAEDKEYVATRISEYAHLRDVTVEFLNDSGVFEVIASRGTSYVFPKVLTDGSTQQVALALKEKAGVVVNPGYQFGKRGDGHIRLCVAQDESVWLDKLERMARTVREL